MNPFNSRYRTAALIAAFALPCMVPVTASASITASGSFDPAHPSTWTGTTNGGIGYSAYGSMSVTSGSILSNNSSSIGTLAGGNGTVTVNAARWTSAGSLTVGNQNGSTGTLGIHNLGEVFANTVNIASSTGSTGTVTMSGNSLLSSVNHVSVGNGGTGTLNASGGADIISRWGSVGSNAASTATISGTGSTWNISDTLDVGFYGDGTLNILSGGLVDVGTGVRIAVQANSTSQLTISGNNATLNTDNGINVGYDGDGTLDILFGGDLITTTTYGTSFIGRNAGSTGTVTVEGNGSTWITSGSINIGAPNSQPPYTGGATGILNINDGGLVEAKYVHVDSTWGTLNTSTGGTLRINGGSLSGITDLTGLNVEFVNGASGTYANLNVDSTLNVSSGSVITVSGTLDVAATGSLGGNGQISGNVANAGSVGPGNSPGALTINGDYDQAATGTLVMELGGTTPGTEYDTLTITGNATLDGALDVSVLFGFDLAEEMQFQIIDIAGTRTGTFDGLNQGAKFGDYDGLQFQIDYAGGDGNDVVLTVVPEPTSLAPLALGGLLLIRRRRRSWR